MPMELCWICWHMRGARFRDLIDQIMRLAFVAKSSQGWGLLEGGPLTAALVSDFGPYRRVPVLRPTFRENPDNGARRAILKNFLS